MDLMILLVLQFQVSRGFDVKPTPFSVVTATTFDVRPGQLPPSTTGGNEPQSNLVTLARDRAAREGRVLIVWVGTKNERLASSLPRHWVQAGPISEYGGETGPGTAIGVPDQGKMYYRRLVPQRLEAIYEELHWLAPTPSPQTYMAPSRSSTPRNC